MASSVKTSRGYDAPARRRQADATRQRVLAAATDLFVARGYAGTSMGDVAEAAGVAVQTVYSSVGGKAALLKTALDVAIVGDDDPIPMMDRPQIHAVAAETDGRRKLEMFAAHVVTVLERTARLVHVLVVAADADPDMAALLDAQTSARHRGMTAFATNLKEQGLLRRGLSARRAADVLDAHLDQSVYLRLVGRYGWSHRDYQRWYVDVTAAALLAPRG